MNPWLIVLIGGATAVNSSLNGNYRFAVAAAAVTTAAAGVTVVLRARGVTP